MIWDAKHESMPREELRRLQGERLKAIARKVYDRVPFYKSKFNALGVKPEDINGIDDIAKLPFTSKDDMRDVFPYGLLACDLKDIVEIHTSSGTTGKPVVDAYTQGDIDLWGEVMARTLSMGGVTAEDIVQNAYGYGLFTGGLGAHYGIRRIGATCIPISGGNTKRQLDMMRDFGSTALTCTPSYSLYLAEAGKEEGIDFSKLPLRVGFFGAEPWSESMRADIQAKLHIKAYDIFGLTEIIGPGVAAECECQDLLHVFEDHFYPEIINPDTGKPLPDGEKGELVFTTLTKEGTPVIRYRTRDITYLTREPCPCGRTAVRMHRILGRTDDMLIIRGVNIFPSQVEQVLIKMDGVEPHYQLLVERQGTLDCLEVLVEMTEGLFSDELKRLEQKEREIEDKLREALLVHSKVKLVEPKSIPRSEGKAKRIIDKRSI
ncbi:MAG: phenylacetate--CoA ligase [Chitinispirillia bacterium]|nr:phenylacetate--CoA ligase [Chitinispirillia bacterium]MCL2268687.1 phenylacetate--CoA ligase [Chitinispirillia bacterium]